MSKYKEIDDIKSKIDELNVLLKKAQDSNFVLRLTINNLYDQETQTNAQQVILTEALYSERIV